MPKRLRTHRRHAKKFSLTRETIKRFAVIGLSLCVFAGLGYYSASNWNNLEEIIADAINAEVDSILVEGAEYTSKEALAQALALTRGASLVGFDADAARKRLEALPWVREAVVNRSLPSTVRVDIFEHKPIARLLDDAEGLEQVWVIGLEGQRIVLDETGDFAHLPMIRGLGAAEQAVELMSLLRQTAFYDKVSVAVFIGERRWNLGFEGDMWVQLPENDPLKALHLLAELDARKQVLSVKGGMVDLRLEDRIIFRMPPKERVKERVL